MALTVPRYTVTDLDDFPEDGNRYELLDGVLLVTPAPGVPHEVVISRLVYELASAVQKPGLGYVFSHGAVRLMPRTHLEPDIMVVPPEFSLTSEWEHITARWLVVEVLSRSSRMYDRNFKRDAYLAMGVQEVWIVDRDSRTVEVSRPDAAMERVTGVLAWRVPGSGAAVAIDLASVFAEVG